VVEVWRQRGVFEVPIQEAIEARVDGNLPFSLPSFHMKCIKTNWIPELDKNRSSGKKPLLGGSLFSSGSVPPELQPIIPLQVAVSKGAVTSGAAVNTANAEFDKMNDPGTPTPSAPVHAARLSQLLKSLANAESSVAEIIKSRQALMEGLEKMLESNRIALARDTTLLTQMGEKKSETETRKRDVEDAIMRGLSAEDSSAGNNAEGGQLDDEPARPNVEALTPPPVESLTPVGSPGQDQQSEANNTLAPQPHPFTLSDHSMDLTPDIHDGTAGGEGRNGFN
jgi:regulator of Ty1 transposition protein 103